MFRTKCHRAFLSLKGRGMIRDTSRSQEEIKGLFKDFGMTMGYLEDLRYVRLPLTPLFVTAWAPLDVHVRWGMHKSPFSAYSSGTSSKRFWTLSSFLVTASLVPLCGWAWAQDGTAQNITLQSYQRELVYIPELCNATGADVANGCSGAW